MDYITSGDEEPEKDINDIFSSIAFPEQTIADKSFHEGLPKGETEGRIDGYHFGYHKGLQIGTEIGYYKGIVNILNQKITSTSSRFQCSEKVIELMTKLSNSLNEFPQNNVENINLNDLLTDIRTDFRKLTSLLKLKLSYCTESKYSF